MTSYRLFPSASGPSSANSYSGNFQAGVVFGVSSPNPAVGATTPSSTEGVIGWFEGYWWWVAPSGGQPTGPQKFALWQLDGAGTGHLIEASVVTSGTLSSGWNNIPLTTPIPLTIANNTRGGTASTDGAAIYVATTAFSGSFPITAGDFGASGTYHDGILSGPLLGYSDRGGTAAVPSIGVDLMQGEFATSYSDPTIAPPNNNSSGSSNFWLDVSVNDTAPSGYSGSYRLFPNIPSIVTSTSPLDTAQQTTGTMFYLSHACTVNKVWFYSSPQLSVSPALPPSTQIWNLGTPKSLSPTLVKNLSGTWSGQVGSGWVAMDYSSAQLTLPAGYYAVTVYNPGGNTFYVENRGYFGTGVAGSHVANAMGVAPNGITNGPISTPGNAKALSDWGLGNSLYLFTSNNAPTFPNGWDDVDDGENRWVDIEVTPGSSAASPPATTSNGVPLTFFP